MKSRRQFLAICLFITLIISFFLWNITEAQPGVYYGKVIATEGKAIQVKGKDGRVSVFWLGHRTKFDTRVPLFGDRVKIEYVKDKLNRNAVTRVTILGK